MRLLYPLAAAAVLLWTTALLAAKTPQNDGTAIVVVAEPAPVTLIPSTVEQPQSVVAACCKVCSTGKACGNSCTS